MLLVPEAHQGVHTRITPEYDRPTISPITTIRPTPGPELLTPATYRSISTTTSFNFYYCTINHIYIFIITTCNNHVNYGCFGAHLLKHE